MKKRILALVMAVVMLAACCSGYAAPATGANDAVVLQGVNMSAGGSVLSGEEAQAYAEVVAQLMNGAESVSVGSTVYTMDAEGTNDEQVTLTGITYSDESSVGISSVRQVVLPTPAEENVTPSEPEVGEGDADSGNPDEGEAVVTPSEPEPLPEIVVDNYGPVAEENIYDDKYESKDEQVLTMMELYEGLGGNITDPDELAAYKQTEEYKFYDAFAKSAGLGSTSDRMELLRKITYEYNTNKAAYDAYLEALKKYEEEVKTNPDAVKPEPVAKPVVPSYTLNSLEIGVDKNVTDAGENGYKAEIAIDANATYTVEYEGNVSVEVQVPTDKGTDFVITLDASSSMDGSADKAMLQALKVVVEEIMANPKNTLSIVFYGSKAGELKLDTNGDGKLESVFSAANVTADQIFGLPMAGRYSSIDEAMAKNYPLKTIRSACGGLGTMTATADGLEAAYDVLSEIYGKTDATKDDRNTGVLLFTDGAVNQNSQEDVIIAERKLVEDFGATVVNVALGTTTTYESYMNPENSSYKYNEDNRNNTIKKDYTADRELLLKENVVYYNIPRISNDQLADKMTELFEMAFKQITTETKKLQTGVITEGILAAVESTLVDTIPAAFEIVKIPGKTPTYKLLGKDENGNTLIAWEIGNMNSGDKFTFSYFLVPVDDKTDVKVEIASGIDTVLVTNPMDKVLGDVEDDTVAIVHRVELDHYDHSTLPKTGVAMIPSAALYLGLALSGIGAFICKRREEDK